jgi:hypothetical protein
VDRGNPALNFLRYLAFGQGEVALATREIIRQYEPDHSRRRTFTPAEERRRAP